MDREVRKIDNDEQLQRQTIRQEQLFEQKR